MTAGGMSLTYIDHLKRHMKCQHAAIIAVQLHADLDSLIQPHHGIMYHGRQKMPGSAPASTSAG